ncbi:MAG: tellurite resistance TerB family protein [Brasilonema octagenarum HA4186-MV1]|jgi:tellurite resistance protein|uniref:Tellurite resistance protein TerB n=2 Tax=Brasilonema TaxID=383614 RepID=A0A856MGM0_9CYAN|nr:MULTISPECIES: tellurite resistance TerB family protein [Brasilonema]MBW4628317.1 tellurite resistance TerB family protein [Brasilonema octagenarum HA4186-MV1]NMF67184.1 Tellurite resistance protein TerB [Brasilonema octagenarum UFV-OR1]QDL10515.1 Tellurite resistance protein TerB [Brasilonema sennae CENA114]QDL16861.1 Tellurite resistance protein TerB [Brasilonema octagenarum UFV-E1]
MGLFDKMFGGESQVQEALSQPEAIAAIALAATASDGNLSDEQARGILSVLSGMKLFRYYSNDEINRMFEKLLNILKWEGINALFHSAKESLPYDLRETAFAIATDLVLADGVSPQEELEFLNDLSQDLGISGYIAIQIVQVMLVKNRG